MYSNTFDTSNKYVKYRILAIETASDITNNRTKVRVTVEAWRTNSGYTTDGAGTCYVDINGVSYSNSWKYNDGHALTYNSYTVLFSWEDWIYHNPDGTKSVYIAASISHAVFSTNANGYSVKLTDIPRQATLTNAPHFTDEENPTITYNNPAGNVVTSLQACIAGTTQNENGDVIYAQYRDVPINGNSYTFNLTTAEREALRWGTINSNTLTVRFYLKTVLNGQTYYSIQEKILTIVNAAPTLSPEAKDTGGFSVPLTGNANKLIKGFNYVDVKTNAKALKGSSIKTQRISCGDQIINAASGGLNNVEAGDITFSATDSRGNTTTETVTLEVIPYIKLTCNLEAEMPTPAGTTNLKISGNYWAGNFGAQNNTLKVYFRYKENDGAYNDWVEATAKAANNKYTADVPITGLDYRKAYTFQAKAVDKVITIESAEKKVKTIPVYDWGENDFAFNVPVNFEEAADFKKGATFEGKDISEMLMPVGATYYTSDNTDPSTLFGGEWEKTRTLYGGELVAFASAASNGSNKVFANNANLPFSDIENKAYSVTNYGDEILAATSGTICVYPRGIVGMIEVVETLSGIGGSGLTGLWWRGNYNELPAGVTMLPSNAFNAITTGPIGVAYGGGVHSFIYKIDEDVTDYFFINPVCTPYGGTYQPCSGGVGSSLLVKAYAKQGKTYEWRRIS